MFELDDAAWRLLILDARTHTGWRDRPVDDAVLRRPSKIVRIAPAGGRAVDSAGCSD
jgi:hypothetical protein